MQPCYQKFTLLAVASIIAKSHRAHAFNVFSSLRAESTFPLSLSAFSNDDVQGESIYQYTRDPNDKDDQYEGSKLDVLKINKLLVKRSEYKKKSFFQKADSIRDYLESQFGVSINDKTRIWSTQWTQKSKKKDKQKHFSQKRATMSTQKKRVGFQQIGGPIDTMQCQLSEEEIQTLLRERSKARRERNFQKSDAILQQLKLQYVFVDDKLKVWRADGLPIVTSIDAGNEDNISTSYKKTRDSKFITEEDEAYVQQKVKDRILAKIRRDFHVADDIRDELRYLKNVEINDDERSWKVVDKDDVYYENLNEYQFGGKRMANISEEELDRISTLVKNRMDARKEKDFNTADAILRNLAVTHGVRVDDKKMLWHFDGRNVADSRSTQRNESRASNERVPSQRGALKQTKKNQLTDWSVVDEKVLPDGISIPNDYLPDGISIVDEIIQEDSNIVNKDEINSRTELESLTVPYLKEKLREAGLPVSGRKSELIDRLINIL